MFKIDEKKIYETFKMISLSSYIFDNDLKKKTYLVDFFNIMNNIFSLKIPYLIQTVQIVSCGYKQRVCRKTIKKNGDS